MMPLYMLPAILCQVCQMAAAEKKPDITQDSRVITAEVGQNVTLRCSYQDKLVTYVYWYQQRLGGKPLMISTRMKYKTEASNTPEFEDRFRSFAQAQQAVNHLEISDLRLTDSATYYCGILEFNKVEFVQGTFLYVKTSTTNAQHVVQRPALEALRPGESATLSCNTFVEPCVGDQSLYWFRPRSGVAQPEVFYPSTGQCTDGLESQMKDCTSNLTIKSVSPSDAGTYFCALASCGQIVFGNGTRVEILGSTKGPPLLVYCLTVALAGSNVLLFVLVFKVYKWKKRSCSDFKGTDSLLTASDNMSSDVVHYAALSLNRASERHHQEDSVCVYSRVKRKE